MSEKKAPIHACFINSNAKVEEKETASQGEKKVYGGQMLVTTTNSGAGFEKHVYTKKSFVKDGILHIDTEGADLAVIYDKDKVDEFVKHGILSDTDGHRLKEDLYNFERLALKLNEWKTKNPNHSKEELSKAFQEIDRTLAYDEEKEKKRDDFTLTIRRLISKKGSIDSMFTESLPHLFKNIESEEYFAITKPLMDRIYYFPELLENARVVHRHGSDYEVSSRIENKGTGSIGLSHTFRASDFEDAEKYLREYRDWLRGEGLKVLTAYWKVSCSRRRFQFSVSLSEVMEQMSDENRVSKFSVKERKDFWAASRKLENTKLSISIPLPRVKGKRDQEFRIDHSLVDLGNRKIYDVGEDYPNTILDAKVLNACDFGDKSQIGSPLHGSTPKLPPKDIMLSLTFQIRHAQTRDKEVNVYDEGYLMNRGNLGKTFQKNKGKARNDLDRKLNNFEELGQIDKFYKRGEKQKTYIIKNRTQKKTR